MWLSDEVIKAMGFSRMPEGASVKAAFTYLTVYKIDGLVLNEYSTNSLKDYVFPGEEISCAMGNSLNEICRQLLGDDFTEDEQIWKEDFKANPPYLLTAIGSKDQFEITSGWWKQEVDSIAIYDGFQKARIALRKIADERLPRLIASLAVKLYKPNHIVRFNPITSEIFGKTSDDKTLHDIVVSTSAKVTTARNISTQETNASIFSALKLQKRFHDKVCTFIYLALKEEDALKRFLYLFYILEIHTNQEFRKIQLEKHLDELIKFPERIKRSGEEFLVLQQTDSRTLSQKFNWCAIVLWKTLNDDDVEAFNTIKSIRDRIAHGENIQERNLPNHKAELLCLKILGE